MISTVIQLSFHACLSILSVIAIAASVNAAPLTFNFSGVVQDNALGALFPGKSVGDTYSGSFTVDPTASVVSSTPAAANYDGSFFDVTIEGRSYEVHVFNVWSGIYADGVEFDFFFAPGETGFLSLRSTANIYDTPDVPTSYDANDFDELAQIHASICPSCSLSYRSSVDTISVHASPEPNTFILVTLGILGMSCRLRKRI